MGQWICMWINIGNLDKDLNPDLESGSVWVKLGPKKQKFKKFHVLNRSMLIWRLLKLNVLFTVRKHI